MTERSVRVNPGSSRTFGTVNFLHRRHRPQIRRNSMSSRREFLAQTSVATTLAAFAAPLLAQGTKPLRLVIGFPAGVLTDNVARLIADGMKGAYPAGTIVENKTGAGGRIAAEFVKRADADGSTLLLTPLFTFTLYPHVYRNLSYDPLKDFKPVAAVASFDYALTVGPSVPNSVKTLPEFIQWCREDEKRNQYGIPAAGSTPQFIGDLLAGATGVPFSAVAYKGGAPLLQDLIGGQIPAIIDPLPNAFEYHKAGRLRVLTVFSERRSPLLPDIPAIGEYKMGQLAARELFGVFVPATVSDSHVATLRTQLAASVDNSKGGFARMLVNAESMGTSDLTAFTQKETERWKSVVLASGFKAVD
ncbi:MULTISPECIES: tripartite tricarboxylate transporter substrate-binding protein [unclassified Variovorax]